MKWLSSFTKNIKLIDFMIVLAMLCFAGVLISYKLDMVLLSAVLFGLFGGFGYVVVQLDNKAFDELLHAQDENLDD